MFEGLISPHQIEEMTDDSEASDVRVRFLLAEYTYLTQSQRDEAGRVLQSWVALAALISVTTVFLKSDFAQGDFAIVAPFGLLAWCLMEMSILAALLSNAIYLRYLERKVNRLLGDRVLEFETKVAAFWVTAKGAPRASPWILNFLLLGALLLALYVGFAIISWQRIHHMPIKALLVCLLTGSTVAFAGLSYNMFLFLERWESSLQQRESKPEVPPTDSPMVKAQDR